MSMAYMARKKVKIGEKMKKSLVQLYFSVLCPVNLEY